ncbi:MAG TPA: magnesium/cobalt efflux protein [Treponema sp.]|nr:magnesium/cobalt efflux protein [Treponema sp.]
MGLFSFGKKKDKKSEEPSSNGEFPSQQELLAEEKHDMIQGVEELSVTTVKEVMVPRIDVDFISLDTAQEELLPKITESGHSRLPVYSGSIDNVVGVLYVKDILTLFAQGQAIDLGKIIRKAYFVPESKHIDSLLREFKRKHVHIAIAIDEYGGVSGIVCMEDIIEQIVGDIQDEFDNEREDIISMGDNVWICDARVDLDDVNETIGTSFPTEDFDTLGGFVFDLFGKIPVKFEKVSWKNCDFIVQDMEGHKVNVIKLIVRKDKREDLNKEP